MSDAAAGSGVSVRPARPGDVPLLLELFGELAAYERLAEEMVADETLIEAALFGPDPPVQALIAERGGEAAGYAAFFPTFSTFLGTRGIWLEDLFVRPQHRRAGVGRALLARVAATLRAGGGQRLEWAALTWNELALGFYHGLGARRSDEWVTLRLAGEDLERLAQEDGAPGP